MGDLKEELEKMDLEVVRGKYISNAWNIEHLPTREEFLKVAKDAKRVYHNDLSDMRVSSTVMEQLLEKHDYLEKSDFKLKDGKGTMYYIDQEEFICSDGAITVRFVEKGE